MRHEKAAAASLPVLDHAYDLAALALQRAPSTEAVASGETPRTDEEVEVAKKFPATSHGLWVSAEFARQLERELAVANENRRLQADAIRGYERDLEKALANHTADLNSAPSSIKESIHTCPSCGYPHDPNEIG